MDLSKIQDLWEKDSALDISDNINSVSQASADTPKLHAKYFKILSEERLEARRLELKMKERSALLWKFYAGMPMDEDELDFLRLDPINKEKRVLKDQIRYYIDADKPMLKLQTMLEYQNEKVSFLEEIIKQLNNRSFQLKNVIEWKRLIIGM